MTKTKNKKQTSKMHQTSDGYYVPYQMAKEIYIEELTEVNKNVSADQRLPKDISKHLTISVESVTVESFDKDKGIFINLKIRGSKKDINKVNEVLQARYKE